MYPVLFPFPLIVRAAVVSLVVLVTRAPGLHGQTAAGPSYQGRHPHRLAASAAQIPRDQPDHLVSGASHWRYTDDGELGSPRTYNKKTEAAIKGSHLPEALDEH